MRSVLIKIPDYQAASSFFERHSRLSLIDKIRGIPIFYRHTSVEIFEDHRNMRIVMIIVAKVSGQSYRDVLLAMKIVADKEGISIPEIELDAREWYEFIAEVGKYDAHTALRCALSESCVCCGIPVKLKR